MTTSTAPTTVEPTTGELPTTTAGPASDSHSTTGTTGTSTGEPDTTGTSTGPGPVCGDASVDDVAGPRG